MMNGEILLSLFISAAVLTIATAVYLICTGRLSLAIAAFFCAVGFLGAVRFLRGSWNKNNDKK